MAAHIETFDRPDRQTRTHSPSYQAYQILHVAFVIAPVVAGLDKFFHLLVDWDKYASPLLASIVPVHPFMMVVGAVEIVAGLLVALRPRIGAWVVAAWLAGIIVNLVLCGKYFDVALRDVGLCLGAVALGRLAMLFDVRERKHA